MSHTSSCTGVRTLPCGLDQVASRSRNSAGAGRRRGGAVKPMVPTVKPTSANARTLIARKARDALMNLPGIMGYVCCCFSNTTRAHTPDPQAQEPLSQWVSRLPKSQPRGQGHASTAGSTHVFPPVSFYRYCSRIPVKRHRGEPGHTAGYRYCTVQYGCLFTGTGTVLKLFSTVPVYRYRAVS